MFSCRDADNEVVNSVDAANILVDAGKVFCKPSTGSCGGRGCFVKDFSNAADKNEVLDIHNEENIDFRWLLH